MSKKCGKCEKAVYPAEELKCLDKSWHKSCFRCTECNMALTLNNFKGFNKLPYCKAHYPTLSHTQVADTPEMKRNMANSRQQSQLEYHAEFNKIMKGTGASVGNQEYTRPMREYTEDEGYSAAPAMHTGYSEAPKAPMGGGGGGHSGGGLVYTALYDYDAADDDEVGFQENDRIINCEVVDDGWISGTVERTGQKGMIPANYVEQV